MTLSAVKLGEMINWEKIVDQLSGASAAMVVKAAQDAAKAAVLREKRVLLNRIFKRRWLNFEPETHRHKSPKGCQTSTTSNIFRCCYATKGEPAYEALESPLHKRGRTTMHDRPTVLL